MVAYFLRRIALTIPTFLALMFLTFAAIRLVPGDPVEVRTGEHGMSPERLAYFRHALGLDQPGPPCVDGLLGLADGGRQVRVSVRGDRDPGYGSTSKMIAECAICLLRDAPEVAGGIWTPGAAMGDHLIKRLAENAGLTFQVEAR